MTRVLTLAMIAAFVLARPCGAQDAAPPPMVTPDWLDSVQTYCMVPLLPERAAELNVSVNGVWGGMGSTDPILPTITVPAVREEYGDDAAAFVGAVHAAGQYAVATVNGLEGYPALKEMLPNLEDLACRNAKGEVLSMGEDALLMCVNHPEWVQWQIDFGKKGIDAGADLVLVDTPMSASFIAGILGGGFCDACMDLFEHYLKKHFTSEELNSRFGVTNFDRPALIARLSSMQPGGNPPQSAFVIETPDALLFREFMHCQDQAAFDTRKTLFDTLRQYAASKNRKVAFTTNAGNMATINPGGHWVRALMFADLVDIFTREQCYSPSGAKLHEMLPYPRGKWAPFHLLCYAIHHRRGSACVPAGTMGTLIDGALEQDKPVSTWMGIQCAEAYASNGAYIQYHIEPIGKDAPLAQRLVRGSAHKKLLNIWRESADYSGFVLQHKDLYDGALRSGSNTAIVFLFNERGRAIPAVYPSYIGWAQGLLEGGFSFDVLFGGDGHFVQDRLTAADLEGYETLLVPSPIDPTPNQQALLKEFVEDGGTLVCQEPERLGLAPPSDAPQTTADGAVAHTFSQGAGKVLVLKGEVSASWTGDVGSEYFKNYDATDREAIIGVGESLRIDRILDRRDGLVCAYANAQMERKRVVVHLVNYDIDYETDAIREKENVAFRLKRSLLPVGTFVCEYWTPGADAPDMLSVTDTGEHLECNVPRLGATGIAVLTVNDEASGQ